MEGGDVVGAGISEAMNFSWLAGSGAMTTGISRDEAFKMGGVERLTFCSAGDELQKLLAESQGIRGSRNLAMVDPVLLSVHGGRLSASICHAACGPDQETQRSIDPG
jgi:hypothetical protein